MGKCPLLYWSAGLQSTTKNRTPSGFYKNKSKERALAERSNNWQGSKSGTNSVASPVWRWLLYWVKSSSNFASDRDVLVKKSYGTMFVTFATILVTVLSPDWTWVPKVLVELIWSQHLNLKQGSPEFKLSATTSQLVSLWPPDILTNVRMRC